MSNFIFAPQAIAGLPILGTDSQFPVRRIYCVGRNYAAHAREMVSIPTASRHSSFASPMTTSPSCPCCPA